MNKIPRRIFAIGLPVLTVAAILATVLGLSHTVSDFGIELSRSAADAILTGTNFSEGALRIPIQYYDQVADPCINLYSSSSSALKMRAFEWKSCGYYNNAYEPGLTAPLLNDDNLPVALGGEDLPNRGVNDFSHWFSAVEGKSVSVPGTLGLNYNAASFSFESEDFYPLNSRLADTSVKNEPVNKDGKNHLFTFALNLPFEVLADGNESFALSADDDTWVFLNDKLILDLGGIHDVMSGRFKINASGEIYSAIGDEDYAYSGVRLTQGEGAFIRIFHADRNSDSSVFRLNCDNILLTIVNTKIADNPESGSEVALVDSNDPTYVAPLGESSTFRPNKSRAILTTAVVQVSILGSLMVLAIVVATISWRTLRKK